MSELKAVKILLTIIVIPVLVLMLKTLKAIFIPLIIAIFLSFLFAPLITALEKRKVPSYLTIILVLVIIFFFFALIGGVIFAATNTFISEFPKYQQKLVTMIDQSSHGFHQLGERASVMMGTLPFFDFSELIAGAGFSLPRILSGTMGTFIDFGINLFLTMIFLMFIVSGTGKLESRLKKVINQDDNVRTLATMLNIQTQIQRYFFNKTLISLGTALTGMFFLIIFGVDFVIITGLLLFILNFIPNIGSIIASSFPVIIALVQYGFGWRVGGVALTMIGTQMIFANILEPRLMGEKLNLTPIMILISLIFWGWVWGITGMMLAVPITSAINIILKHFDDNNLISAIISDI